jgi:hypothetical protein
VPQKVKSPIIQKASDKASNDNPINIDNPNSDPSEEQISAL